jgi:KaiC/GvpD/RAD55 family RecA-like ATPase
MNITRTIIIVAALASSSAVRVAGQSLVPPQSPEAIAAEQAAVAAEQAASAAEQDAAAAEQEGLAAVRDAIEAERHAIDAMRDAVSVDLHTFDFGVHEPFSIDLHTFDFGVHEPFSIDLSGLHDVLGAVREPLAAVHDAFAQRTPTVVTTARPFGVNTSSPESLYNQARGFIDRNQYDRALTVLDRLIGMGGARTDAAMYWKAYTSWKMARHADALATLADLQKQFAASAWVGDARSLELEIRQASGQSVAAEAQDDEELKLLALRGVMQTNPETALPVIEAMLAGDASVRLKDRALFVLSQSGSTRARQVIAGVARRASNPDLQMQAIRYLGMRSGADSLQVLNEVYRESTDTAVKRAIIRGFGTAGARDRLLAAAKSETSPELRGEAVQQLGAMRAANELAELYGTETNADVKKRILQALFAANAADKLGPIARSEKDPELRRAAIRQLGLSNRPEAAETLASIYASDTSLETRKAVIEALARHNNAGALVALARAETNTELKTEMVRRLSTMRSPEASAYLLELLK